MKRYTIIDEARKTKGEQAASFAGFIGEVPKTRGDSLNTDSIVSKRASVWLLKGKTITRRFIRTGLEDGTQVQVVSGLTLTDEVIDGIQQAGTEATQNNNDARSPFMPPRRGGGGGGNRGSQGSGRSGARQQ